MASPWRSAFRAERCFPLADLGPELFRALMRFDDIFFRDVTANSFGRFAILRLDDLRSGILQPSSKSFVTPLDLP